MYKCSKKFTSPKLNTYFRDNNKKRFYLHNLTGNISFEVLVLE